MTTKEIGHLMFVIPACCFVAFAIGVMIWGCWEVAKTEDEIEAHLGNPNSIKHRVGFIIFMLMMFCMSVGGLLSDHC
jgi:TRAP-type C4-dicarboxylate transport system permease small subunit